MPGTTPSLTEIAKAVFDQSPSITMPQKVPVAAMTAKQPAVHNQRGGTGGGAAPEQSSTPPPKPPTVAEKTKGYYNTTKLNTPVAPRGIDTQKHFQQADGSYHPDRAEHHERIINHYMGQVDERQTQAKYGDVRSGKPQKNGVFLAGGSGVGKSFYKDKKYGHHARFVHIDPDAIKEHLPEYNPSEPHHVHEESSDVAKELHKRAMAAGHSFIYDGTGKSAESMGKKFDQSRAAGYQVHARRVHVPEATAWKQNEGRKRTVSKEIFHDVHSGVEESWPQIAKMADSAKVIDNRRPAEPDTITQRRQAHQNNLQLQGRLAKPDAAGVRQGGGAAPKPAAPEPRSKQWQPPEPKSK